MNEQQDAQYWLLKSGSRIVGPIRFSELVDKLRQREINILDEVALPTERWRYIRDEARFAGIVEELRLSFKPTSEMTTTITPGNKTSTNSITARLESQGENLSEIVYDHIQEIRDVKPPPQAKTAAAKGSYGVRSDVVVQTQVRKTQKVFWVFALLVFLGVGAFGAYYKFIFIPQNKVQISTDDVKEGLFQLSIGEYHKALSHLKKAYAANPHNTSIYVYLAPLLIQIDGQVVEAKRLLAQIPSTDLENFKLAQLALALAAFHEEDLNSAEKFIRRSLAIDPANRAAQIDLALVALAKQNFVQARELLLPIVEGSVDDGIALLLLAQTNIELFKQGRDKMFLLTETHSRITKFLSGSLDYWQELNLAAAYMDYLLGSKDKLTTVMARVLDVDPEQTNLHRHNLFVYRKKSEWRLLINWCEELVNASTETVARALHALCLAKAGQTSLAKGKIEEVATQASRDALMQSLYGYILQQNGLNDQASVAIGRADTLNVQTKYELPGTLQARFCQEQGDLECAFEKWSKVLQQNSSSLAALTGVASIYGIRHQTNEAKQNVDRGLSISGNYKPLLFLKKKLDSGEF